MTLHVGSGLENDDVIDALLEDIIAAADALQFPISVETHRATITQDMWRTVRMVERHPDLRINGDFSHWYTGLEMVYGDFEKKLDFMQPVLERVTHFHGRIGTPGAIQTDITGKEDSSYVQHFCAIWQRTFNAFQKNAAENTKLVFAPELLFPNIYYAPVDADGQEIGDRWADAQTMCQLVRSCWESAAAVPA